MFDAKTDVARAMATPRAIVSHGTSMEEEEREEKGRGSVGSVEREVWDL